MTITLNHLLDCIGEIDELFLEEAENTSVNYGQHVKRKRIVAYSAAGLAVSVGVAVAYWFYKKAAA